LGVGVGVIDGDDDTNDDVVLPRDDALVTVLDLRDDTIDDFGVELELDDTGIAGIARRSGTG
jgi:hypothetical protein